MKQGLEKMGVDVRELFDDMFEDGNDVIIITDEDKFHHGTLNSYDDGCLLQQWNGKSQFIEWYHVRFICKDGFPVKQCMGADNSDSILKIDTKDLRESIRHSLLEYTKLKAQRTVDMRFGHPFDVEGVKAKLYNKGNVFPEIKGMDKQILDWRLEETIVMKAKDGAEGMLWDVPSIFLFN